MLRLAAILFAGLLAGCNQGGEGRPCQSSVDASDPCTEGLTCQMTRGCVGSYCCPTPASMSSDPHCNGMACTSQ
jgi:hypothetical protein